MTAPQEFELIATLSRLETTLKEHRESVDNQLHNLHARLFGNGQPGELQKLELRIRSGEEFDSKSKGVMGTLLFVVGLLGIHDIARLFKLL